MAGYLYVNNPDFFQTKNESVSCRIGITTDLKARKQYWKGEYLKEGKVIKNWTVLSVHQSKAVAQKVETREAKKQNCVAYPVGKNSTKKHGMFIDLNFKFFNRKFIFFQKKTLQNQLTKLAFQENNIPLKFCS